MKSFFEKPLRLAFLTLLASGSLFASSCSRQKAPDPPKTRAELLLDIFASLKRQDHMAALNKISRLHDIDKNSVFLTEFESLERNNTYVLEARRLLAEDNIQGAVELLDGALKRHGKQETLVKARASLASLSELSRLIDVLNAPRSAGTMTANANMIIQLAKTFKPAEVFVPFAEAKIREAATRSSFEEELALFDLASDVDVFFEANRPESASALAMLAIEAPRDQVYKRLASSPSRVPAVFNLKHRPENKKSGVH